MSNLERLSMDSFDTWNWWGDVWVELHEIRPTDWLDLHSYVSKDAQIVRSHAIGYCPSNQLRVRPKSDGYAVMFQVDKTIGWAHMSSTEFFDAFGVR